jgi:hypothetical protein
MLTSSDKIPALKYQVKLCKINVIEGNMDLFVFKNC